MRPRLICVPLKACGQPFPYFLGKKVGRKVFNPKHLNGWFRQREQALSFCFINDIASQHHSMPS
jgi:hypothetical protein